MRSQARRRVAPIPAYFVGVRGKPRIYMDCCKANLLTETPYILNIYGVSVKRFALQKTVHVDTRFFNKKIEMKKSKNKIHTFIKAFP